MTRERDVTVGDGRVLRVHDSGEDASGTILWHPGSPHTGRIPPALLAATAARDLQVVSYARPGYGGSTPKPGRTVHSAVQDVDALADTLRIGRFAVLGYSGGGPHALATAAALPDRVTAVATFASIAPYTGSADWFEGMASDAALRSALAGRRARADFAEIDDFDPTSFIESDWASLAGAWAALGADAEASVDFGPDGLIDDDTAFMMGWGFDPGDITVPTLLVQGDGDRIVPPAHGRALAAAIPGSELWMRTGAGHVAVLEALDAALDWITEQGG